MKKGEKKKLNKIAILSTTIIIVTLIIGIVVICVPFLNKNKSLRAEILHQRDKNVLIGKIRAISKHLRVYKKRVPEGRGVSWLLSEVSEMAEKEQIEVISIKPGTPETRTLYTKIYVTMEINSTYKQLGMFLSRVESSEKFMRVENIDTKRLDLDEKFEIKKGKFKAFDVKSQIVISTIILKDK